jgi:DNA replication and repair protein RecF
VYLRRLLLWNFRNYAELDLALTSGRLLFLGDNAQGKSNLLEAVYLLAAGRSVRATADSEMIGWGGEAAPQPVARVAAEVERAAGALHLEVAIVGPAASTAAQAARAGKRFRVNGVPRRLVDLIGQLKAVLFTASDIEIVLGAPAERRRFLDAMLSQQDARYHTASQRYARVLQQRNALLRRLKEGLASPEELTFWDDSLAREGGVVLAARCRAAARLADLAAAAHARLSGRADESLGLEYQPRLGEEWRGLLDSRASVEEARSVLAAALLGQRRREAAAGASLVGPHRDDLAVSISGQAAAAFASRAQARTAALALRLAEARLLEDATGDPPVVLLDDITSELDERRRRSVMEGIAPFQQVWFTASDAATLPPGFAADGGAYRVEAGRITPL